MSKQFYGKWLIYRPVPDTRKPSRRNCPFAHLGWLPEQRKRAVPSSWHTQPLLLSPGHLYRHSEAPRPPPWHLYVVPSAARNLGTMHPHLTAGRSELGHSGFLTSLHSVGNDEARAASLPVIPAKSLPWRRPRAGIHPFLSLSIGAGMNDRTRLLDSRLHQNDGYEKVSSMERVGWG